MLAVLLLAAGYALKWADAQVVSVVLPQIKAEFAVSDTALGLLVGLPFAIFYAVLGVPIARLADRGTRRDIVAGAVAAFSAATALAAAAPSFLALFATRILVGVGEAGATPPAQSLIADIVPARRQGFAMAFYGAGVNVGVLFGFVAGGMVASHWGWRAACLVVAAPGFVVAALTRWLIREPARRAPAAAVPSLGEVVRTLGRDRAYLRLLAATTLANLVGLTALAWAPSFLARSDGMDARASGLFLGLMTGLVGLAGIVIAGWLADRVPGRRHVFLAGAAFLVWPSLLLFYLLPGFHPVLFVLPAALGAVFGGIAPALIAERVPDAMRATALSVLLLVVNVVATILGPVVVGAASDAFGLRAALALSTLAMPAAAYCYLRGSAP